jgi:hypothetical protein
MSSKRTQALKKQYRVVLTAEQRSEFLAEAAAAKCAPERVTELRILLLADEGPGGPAVADAKIAKKFNITNSRVEYVRTCFAAPEVMKRRIALAVKNARATPRARKLTQERQKRYYSKPEVQEKLRHYRKNLPPEVRARKNQRAKEYRSTEQGREKRRLIQQKYRNTPRGKAKKRVYVERHKAKANERYKKRYRTDPQFKIAVALRKRVVLALKTRGISKSRSLLELLGCSIPALKEHLENQFRAGMSWANHGKWHVDHIRPCAAFDLTRVEEQKLCFHYSNLQPLWAEENMRKSAKILP